MTQSVDATKDGGCKMVTAQRTTIAELTAELALKVAGTTDRETRFRQTLARNCDSIAKLNREIAPLRAQLESNETLAASMRAQVQRDEAELRELRRETFDLARRLEIEITSLTINGTDGDKQALDSLFYRPGGQRNDAPYSMPPPSACYEARQLLHGVYYSHSPALVAATPPDSSLLDVASFSEHFQVDGEPVVFLKVVRVFRRARRPEIVQFLCCSAALAARGKMAVVCGTASKYMPTRREIHDSPIPVTFWFSPADSPSGEFPHSNSETFSTTLVGCDYGAATAIFSSTNACAPELGSALSRRAELLGLNDASQVPPPLAFVPDWQDPFWRKQLPLECAGSTHTTGKCVLQCTPLAVRVKCSDAGMGYSVLCEHEPTHQLFWIAFDPDNIDALRQPPPDDSCSIERCDCERSLTRRVEEFQLVPSIYKLPASAPLVRLRNSGVIDKATAASYAIIHTVAGVVKSDPATVLQEALECGQAIDYYPEMPVDLGRSQTVSSASNSPAVADNRKRRSDSGSPENGGAPASGKRRSPAMPAVKVPLLTAKTVKGRLKESKACSICGIVGFADDTHLKVNHGSRGTFSQEELAKWRAALVRDRGEEEANKLIHVGE